MYLSPIQTSFRIFSSLLTKYLESKVVVQSAPNNVNWIKSEAVKNANDNLHSAVLPKLETKPAKSYVPFIFCMCR